MDDDPFNRDSLEWRSGMTIIKGRWQKAVLVARAKRVLDWMSGGGDMLLWLRHWYVWPNMQHMPLFTRLREAVGEHRPLIEAPGQLITPSERDDGVSVLALAMWFLWDCTILSESH